MIIMIHHNIPNTLHQCNLIACLSICNFRDRKSSGVPSSSEFLAYYFHCFEIFMSKRPRLKYICGNCPISCYAYIVILSFHGFVVALIAGKVPKIV